MRLFGSDRVASIMGRFGQKEMEPIESPMVSRAIAGAQKRVEVRNAEMRKHLLEYDDVMNKEREVVYHLRDQLLSGDMTRTASVRDRVPGQEQVDLKEVFKEVAADTISDLVARHANARHPEDWAWPELHAEFVMTFLDDFEVKADDLPSLQAEDLVDTLIDKALVRYDQRQQQLGDELFANLLKAALLRTLDVKWRDHLYSLDMVREGINLRAYGEKDPLVEYKHESFKMFDEMMADYRREALTFLFRAELQPGRPPPAGTGPRAGSAQPIRAYKPETTAGTGPGAEPEAGAAKPAGPEPVRRSEAKVGRNDKCPCGSGKKYKKCCGKTT